MRIKKSLRNMILSSSLVLNQIGCSKINNEEYHFDGKIGNDSVKFYEGATYRSSRNNFLEIKKEDGSLIKFVYENDDLLLDYVQIKVGENTTKYFKNSNNPDVKEVIENFEKFKFQNSLRRTLLKFPSEILIMQSSL